MKTTGEQIDAKFEIVKTISAKVGELCKALEEARAGAAAAGISTGYEIRYDSVGDLVDFKCWIREAKS